LLLRIQNLKNKTNDWFLISRFFTKWIFINRLYRFYRLGNKKSPNLYNL
jgi:hypothetical protein